ncbi:MAG: helix-turn-helix transcriptional regulator [Bacteroidales bacterium]|nr:helix-turn-helix transcriptional regulator [Bacteroidales bacterium]
MDKIIARNLKKLREAAKYTQAEVADALAITRSAYSNYETGDREIPYEVIEKASDFYGCEMYDLFIENENVDALILASAFRVNGISATDQAEIIHFKDVVKSYLKLEAIERQ